MIGNITLEANNTLAFQVRLQTSLNEFDEITVILPNETYINQENEKVVFLVINP